MFRSIKVDTILVAPLLMLAACSFPFEVGRPADSTDCDSDGRCDATTGADTGGGDADSRPPFPSGDSTGPMPTLGTSTGDADSGDTTGDESSSGSSGLDEGTGGSDRPRPEPGPPPFKGIANSPCDVRNALGVTWYYNWGQSPGDICDDGSGGEFVPMIWGHDGSEQSFFGIQNDIEDFVQDGYAHVLGFNEPDGSDQAHMSIDQVLSLLPAFEHDDIIAVSPATSANSNGRDWFEDFVGLVDGSGLELEVVAIHWYGWHTGTCDANASQFEDYIEWIESFTGDRPIWITEFGCLNDSNPDYETVAAFYEGAVEMFERHPRIQRHAWYPWETNNNVVFDDGTLTPVGEAIAAAPAHRQ